MKETEVIAVSTDSFQRSKKDRHLWFPNPSQPSLKLFDTLREMACTFQRHRDSRTAAVENFSLHSAQVVIMKLNTHNSFIKQLHCVIVTK